MIQKLEGGGVGVEKILWGQDTPIANLARCHRLVPPELTHRLLDVITLDDLVKVLLQELASILSEGLPYRVNQYLHQAVYGVMLLPFLRRGHKVGMKMQKTIILSIFIFLSACGGGESSEATDKIAQETKQAPGFNASSIESPQATEVLASDPNIVNDAASFNTGPRLVFEGCTSLGIGGLTDCVNHIEGGVAPYVISRNGCDNKGSMGGQTGAPFHFVCRGKHIYETVVVTDSQGKSDSFTWDFYTGS